MINRDLDKKIQIHQLVIFTIQQEEKELTKTGHNTNDIRNHKQ